MIIEIILKHNENFKQKVDAYSHS